MGDVEYGKVNGILLLVEVLRLFDGPSTNIFDMWRMLGRSLTDGGLVVSTIITVDQHLVYVAHAQPHLSNGCLVVGTIIKSILGLQPRPSAMRATPLGRREFSSR